MLFLGIVLLIVALGIGYYLGYRGREITVGIDLGTSYSVIAIKQNNVTSVIPNIHTNSLITPSTVYFNTSGKIQVGLNPYQIDPIYKKSFIYHSKQYIGQPYTLVTNEHTGDSSSTKPYSVVPDSKGFAVFDVPGYGKVTPIEIGRHIIKELIDSAKSHLFSEYKIQSAVICVPVSFDNTQREHTKLIYKSLGISVSRVIEEPIAAAMAYNLHNISNRRVLVFDVGGGTTDITLLWVAANSGSITVLSTSGDSKLGGRNFDQIVLDILNQKCPGEEKEWTVFDAETVKIQLSGAELVQVDEECEITEIDLIEGGQELLDKIANLIDYVLDAVSVDVMDIDDIVMVGGSSRMPVLNKMLMKYFKSNPNIQIHNHLNPDTVVAIGAANILD
jgi:molecular chaperone DnaK